MGPMYQAFVGSMNAALGDEPRRFWEVRRDRARPGADQQREAVADRRTAVRDAAASGEVGHAVSLAALAGPEQLAKGVMSVPGIGPLAQEILSKLGLPGLGRSNFNPATAPANVIGAWKGLFEGLSERN